MSVVSVAMESSKLWNGVYDDYYYYDYIYIYALRGACGRYFEVYRLWWGFIISADIVGAFIIPIAIVVNANLHLLFVFFCNGSHY